MSRSPVDEYRKLLQRQAAGALGPEEQARLELLEDVLHELGALKEARGAAPRPPRADVQLEVVFQSAGALARAFSRNIGTGGIAILAAQVLPPGSTLDLSLKLPDGGTPLAATGKVVWTRDGTMGVAFVHVSAESQRRLKRLVMRDEPLLRRLQQVVGAGAPEPVPASLTEGRAEVLLRLADAPLARVTREVLAEEGVRAAERLAEGAPPPRALVADAESALEAVQAFPRTPLVLVGVSGPDALGGRLGSLRPAHYVKRPVSASAIVDTLFKLPHLRQP